MAKKEKDDNPIVDKSKSSLQAILKTNDELHYNNDEQVNWKSSTGSLLLDIATGGVTPSMIRLCGTNNCGKTPQALEIIRNFLDTVPNSKAFWVLAEGRMSDDNRIRCGLKFVTNPEEWEIGTVFLLKSNIFELFINTVKELVYNNPTKIKYAFVVDSVDGLILKDDSEKDIDAAAKVAGVPALSKRMVQSLSLGMFTYGHLMVLISQVSTQINLNAYGAPPNRGGNFAGGNSLLHASDTIIQYDTPYNGDFILDDANGKFNDSKSKPIGQNVRVTMIKTTKENYKKVSLTYPIKYGKKPSGIWIERELAEMMLQWGFAVKAGAWIKFSDGLKKECATANIEIPELVQGINNLYELLETNKPLAKHLFEKFRAALS